MSLNYPTLLVSHKPYLSEGLSEHSPDLFIHTLDGLLVSILNYHLVHTIHLLD